MIYVFQGKASSGLVLYGMVLQGKASVVVWYMCYRVKRLVLYDICFSG